MGEARALREGELAGSGSVLCGSSGRGWCPCGQLASGFASGFASGLPRKLPSPVELLLLPSEAAAAVRPAALDTLSQGPFENHMPKWPCPVLSAWRSLCSVPWEALEW